MPRLLNRATWWARAVEVHEHHAPLDFSAIAYDGTAAVLIRAGRGTRQDARWIEHVRGALDAGLAVGSWWTLYPSRADAYLQAELWAAAVTCAGATFAAGHWVDLPTQDGLDDHDFADYLRRFFGRCDQLLDEPVGVSLASPVAASALRHRRVWLAAPPADGPDDVRFGHADDEPVVGWRTKRGDRGLPGRHLVCLEAPCVASNGWRLVERAAGESVEAWRSRWMRGPEIAALQLELNASGADLVVDGILGPATASALRAYCALCRRDAVRCPSDERLRDRTIEPGAISVPDSEQGGRQWPK